MIVTSDKQFLRFFVSTVSTGQKRIILIHQKKFHEEQSHEKTDFIDNDKESKYRTDGERMSQDAEDHNDDTKGEKT